MHFGLASRRITTLIRAVFRGATLIRGRCLFEAWCFSEEIHYVEFDDFFLEQKYPFWVNLIKKFKIVSLSWNLVSRLFQICKIWWWLIFCVTPFFAFFVQKTHLALCHLINIPEVYYSKRLVAFLLFSFSILQTRYFQ